MARDQVAEDRDEDLVLAAEVAVEGLQRDVGLLDEVLRREVLAPLEHEPVGRREERLGVGRSADAVPAARAPSSSASVERARRQPMRSAVGVSTTTGITRSVRDWYTS